MQRYLKLLAFLIIPYIYADTLVVGVSADYPPFEYKKHEELLGFDIDLAKKIGESLGCEIKFREMNFAALFTALNENEIDMVISSVGKTAEREKNFDFSAPYYFDKLAIVNKKNVKLDLASKDLRIACQLGSLMETWCVKNIKTAHILRYDTVNQAIESLKAHHADGVVMDSVQAKEFCNNNTSLSYLIVGNSGSGNAVALRKNSLLTQKVNDVLKKLHQEGYLNSLHNKWVENSTHADSKHFVSDILFVAKGAITTVTYALLSLLVSFCLGIALAVLRYKKIGTIAIKSFVSIVRGTPVILQLSFVYFSLPALLGIKISVLVAGVVTFGINSSAYICEILRAGLNSTPKGQFEIAQSLKIPQFLIWKDIILPQVFVRVLPALINEAVTMTKETALISVLGEMDIMRRAQALAAEQYDFFMPLCIAGCVFWLIVKFIEILGHFIEKRFNHA